VLGACGLLVGCTLFYSRDDYVGDARADAGEAPDAAGGDDSVPDGDIMLVEDDSSAGDAGIEVDAAACNVLTEPVFHLVSTKEAAVYVYTASPDEVSSLTKGEAPPYQSRGIAFRASRAPRTTDDVGDLGTVPVYRLHNPALDVRMYTVDEGQRELAKTQGWTNDEGIAFHAFSVKVTGGNGDEVPPCLVPVEGFVRTDKWYRGFSVTPEERAGYVNAGWMSEGILFYAARR